MRNWGLLRRFFGRLRAKWGTAMHLWRTERGRLLRVLCGQYRVYIVFSACPARIGPPDPEGFTAVRELSERELLEAAGHHEELRYHLERLEAVGVSRAFGLFHHGELAHICWLMTVEEDRRLALRLVKLRPGEAEITSAFTLPQFRARGLYPFAIRTLCALAGQRGLGRVFMITHRENRASQRGILKAGLRQQGWIVRIVPPLAPSGRGIILRGFRLKRMSGGKSL